MSLCQNQGRFNVDPGKCLMHRHSNYSTSSFKILFYLFIYSFIYLFISKVLIIFVDRHSNTFIPPILVYPARLLRHHI